METNVAEKKVETKANEYDLKIRELSDSLKRNNSWIIAVPKDEEREKGVEGLCKQIIAETFPNLGKDTKSKSRQHREFPLDSTKTNHNKAYNSQIHKILRQGKNYESSKEKRP